MGQYDFFAETLTRLIDYFGGPETVARILNVSLDDLESWADGRARPPAEVLFRLIDMKADAEGDPQSQA